MCMTKNEKSIKEEAIKISKDCDFRIPNTGYTLNETIDYLKKNVSSEICNLVFKTKNYKLFDHFDANRERRDQNLRNITKSIEANGYIANNPIIVTYKNGKLIILDGAHRFDILKEKIEKGEKINGEEVFIPFIIIDAEDIVKTAQILNLAKSNWNNVDFLSSYAKTNQDYANFKNYLWKSQKYTEIPLWTKIAMVNKLYANSANGVSKNLIKNGLFKFPMDQLDNILFMADRAQEVASICKQFHVTTKLDLFVSSVTWLSEYGNGFNYNQFLANLKIYGNDLNTYDRGNFEKNMSVAIKIHNKGSHSKLRPATFYKAFNTANDIRLKSYNKDWDDYCEKNKNSGMIIK